MNPHIKFCRTKSSHDSTDSEQEEQGEKEKEKEMMDDG